jgi:hypothetical protein
LKPNQGRWLNSRPLKTTPNKPKPPIFPTICANIILPKKALKRDNRYQRDKKRKLCKRRAAIEPIIGHFKSDFRLSRKHQVRVMNRFCFYLWIFEQAHADKTRSAFDKSQTTDIVAVYVAIL